jgi:hypothetical protein
MQTFPTKEQLDKLSNDILKNEEQMNKSDCDYMMSLMSKILNESLNSNKLRRSIYEDIDSNKINNWSNMKMSECKFGKNNQSVEKVLESHGVEFDVCTSTTAKPFMEYNKLRKKIIIFPK